MSKADTKLHGFQPQTMDIPANTTITGPTTVVNGVITNLVTVNGAVASRNVQPGAAAFQVDLGVTGVTLLNLNLANGEGGLLSSGTMVVNHCVIAGNTSSSPGGGINNSGSLTLANSTVVGNLAAPYQNVSGPTGGGQGGGIYNSGTLIVVASTISGNTANSGNSSGGGILNSGTLTLLNTTITGNTSKTVYQGQASPINVVLTGMGGGVANTSSGTFKAVNTTITANTVSILLQSGVTAGPGSGGGGISGVAILQNTIDSGNTSNVGSNDLEGSYADNGGNLVEVAGLGLAPLASYGGPSKTLMPLPSSPAICYGTVANATAEGLTKDQRGLPRKTSYGSKPVICVDAGAVQTNYSLAFTVQPPASAIVNTPLVPAPAVQLTESGGVASYYGGEVSLTDSGKVLSTPTLATLVNGMAVFSDAVITSAVTSDTLSATLLLASTPEIPSLNLVTNASVKVSAKGVVPVPAVMIWPAPGSTLTSGTVTFTWSASNVAGTQYALMIGTSGPGSKDVYLSPPLTGTSVTVNVPTTGGRLYVGLSQGTTGPWKYTPYIYKEATAAILTTPAPGSTLTSGTVTFKWSKSTIPGTQYRLLIGTNGQGSSNIYVSPALVGTSVTVKLPTNGAKLYVGLTQGTTGEWSYTPYTFTEARAGAPTGHK